MKWDEARERLLSGRGTLLIERDFKAYGHVWWVEPDLSAEYPDCPLAPAKVLTPPHAREGFPLIFSGEARKWCTAHLPGLLEGIHLVRVPSVAWRGRDEVLFGERARAVFINHAGCLYAQRN